MEDETLVSKLLQHLQELLVSGVPQDKVMRLAYDYLQLHYGSSPTHDDLKNPEAKQEFVDILASPAIDKPIQSPAAIITRTKIF